MKKLLFILLSVSMLVGLFAVPNPTLGFDMAIPNNIDFTPEQREAALDHYRDIYENWLETPGFHSKGQTGLMILDLFALEDTLAGAAEFQAELIFDQIFEILDALWYLEESFYFITDSVENQYDLIDNLYAFMAEGKADSIIMLADSLEEHLYDTYGMTLDHIYNTIYDVAIFSDSLGTRFDTILTSGEDFIFRIGEVDLVSAGSLIPPVPPVFDTTEVAVIYDETFQSVGAAIRYLTEGLMYFGNGLDNIFNSDSTVQVGLDTLIMSMQSFQNVCDTLNNYSIWSLIDSSWSIDDSVEIGFENIRSGFVEAEALLGGKSYFIGDDVDSVEVRPVGIIESMHHGLYQTYIDLYWQADPYVYTFGNIFPSSLPEDVINQLLPDMILDPRDSHENMRIYLMSLAGTYMTDLNIDSTDVDAHTGLGYMGLFAIIQDIGEQGKTIAALVDGGRIDSLFQNYDWNNLDYTDELFDAQKHLFHQVDEFYLNDTTIIFTVLIKDPNYSSLGHTVIEGDLVYPVYIIPQVTEGVLITTFIVEEAIWAIGEGLEYVYTQVDSMIDITLDPNLLNLSDIEEPLDLIYALETSNPTFGTFTPQGKFMFAALGDSLAVGMQGLSDLADTVVATMDYAEMLMYEFGMSEGNYDTMMMDLNFGSDLIEIFAADLATPEVYSIIDEDTLNLSAWFDDVPDNLLAVWKNYFEGTDSSLAGFFPMHIIISDVDPSSIPVEFAMKGNYPNPFNPLTTIEFDLPSDGMVNMTVFNIAGRQVAKLIDRQSMQAGSYELTWNAADHASGVYIVRAQYGNEVAYQKMTLLK
ncbi:MAG: T9SS type A sorting domain-containing protein [Candidatus Marinimicrobia bacterium]|nr:T9SS type A sorting domain-containing protein [Candidatus Neomarinimicrobiota bacterium]